MSYVTLILVLKKEIVVRHVHYRELICNVNEQCLKKSFSLPIDAGYVVVDYTRRCIVDAQDAVALHHFPKKWDKYIL